MKRKVNFQDAATIELDIINESNDSNVLDHLSDGKKKGGLLDPNPQILFTFNDLSSIADDEQPVAKFQPVAPGPACLNSIAASEYIIGEVLNRVAKDDKKKEAQGRKRAVRLAIAVSWMTAASSTWVSIDSIFRSEKLTLLFLLVVADEWEACKARCHFRVYDIGGARGR